MKRVPRSGGSANIVETTTGDGGSHPHVGLDRAGKEGHEGHSEHQQRTRHLDN